MVLKAKEFDLQEKIVNRGVDGLAAGVRNNNNPRANGNQRRNNPGDRNNANGTKKCDFCKRPNHTWKQCFLLLSHARPSTANHARMDQKRDELLAACPAQHRDKYTKWMQQNGGQNGQQPNGQNVDAEFAFPNEQRQVDGRMAMTNPETVANDGTATGNASLLENVTGNVTATLLIRS